MDTNSSAEDLVIKTRKPYTITKQRERWTEEEHNRFLEALKLYGRAWQRIEEHIGTKTAVQIRSHAQKFFSKLEKEALSKGVPVGQAIDIDIPPPRPKRKPRNPYPRKICTVPPTLQVGANDGKVQTSACSLGCKQVLDLEKEPLEKPNEDEKATDATENQDDNCSDVFTLGQEAHCSSVSSMNKNSILTEVGFRDSCTFGEFVPSPKKDNGVSKASNLDNSRMSHENSVQCKKTDDLNGTMVTDEIQATQSYPRHVPVHILDGNTGKYTQSPSEIPFQGSIFHPPGDVHANPSTVTNPASSVTTEQPPNAPRSPHSPFPTFHHPFTPIPQNQDDYRSFLQISSTFSSLIVSTLLQNPAAHAAASFAATFWPHSNVESSADSPMCLEGGFPARQMSSTPSIGAIAAATVAAATAWWAAHGLLPVCAPLHSAFSCPPPSTPAVLSTDVGQVPLTKIEKKDNNTQAASQENRQLDAEYSEALQAQHSASKSPARTSSDSEESASAKLKTGPKAADLEKPAEDKELHDPNKTKNRKQVDRSSCGSNTPSSSEVETDALEKHENDKEEPKQSPDEDLAVLESGSRRSRSSINITDSWKEVSEEGRLAFQALFTREVLPQSFSPQSFSPPHGLNNLNLEEMTEEEKSNANKKDGDKSLLDLNSKTWVSCSSYQELDKNETIRGENNEDHEGLLTIGLGQGKLKARRTGFKPYKRCSMEAKETRVVNSNQTDEKGPKRIRLEGEAST